ncbi:MAG: prolyl aminopeptidase, partial [Shimia sp.]
NAGFLEGDGQIMRDLPKIAHIPTWIVQGRYDMICPPISAYGLTAGLPEATLKMVPRAGHALSEPGISAALVQVMNALAT